MVSIPCTITYEQFSFDAGLLYPSYKHAPWKYPHMLAAYRLTREEMNKIRCIIKFIVVILSLSWG